MKRNYVVARQVFGEGNIEAEDYVMSITGTEVHECEPADTFTGLLDRHGHRIMSRGVTNPIGFGHTY